jgi:hypothetical protein
VAATPGALGVRDDDDAFVVPTLGASARDIVRGWNMVVVENRLGEPAQRRASALERVGEIRRKDSARVRVRTRA